MHKSSLISITILTILLLGCQKGKISATGHFTRILASEASRSIASNQPLDLIDTKQILIYCQNSNSDIKDCYYSNAKNNKINTSVHSFSKTQQQLNLATRKYESQILTQIQSIVDKRDDFCKQNSLHNFGRCMKMSLIDNTMEILNESNKLVNFNAHEYLYAKEIIKISLSNHYDKKISARLTK